MNVSHVNTHENPLRTLTDKEISSVGGGTSILLITTAALAVKTRLVIYAFYEQIRLFLLPFLECLNRRLVL